MAARQACERLEDAMTEENNAGGPLLKKTAGSLAVFSGLPTFSEMLHVGRPNTGDIDAFLARARGALERRWLTNHGVLVQEFEKVLADRLDVKHCLALSNGTIAIELMLRATGVTGEVIVPAYTFIATAHAVQWSGLTPVFADVDPDTHNISVETVRNLVTPKTSAILGVHLWGRGDGAEELEVFARDQNLHLFYDAAHAFGATHRGRSLASFGHASTFSFHATKCFHTFEGGALATQDDALADRVRLLRNFGFAGYDNVTALGTNAKLNEISAAMGLTMLEGFDGIVAHNRANYERYRAGLAGLPGIRPVSYSPIDQSNFQYVLFEVNESSPLARDELVAVLLKENVFARRYFFPGCHRMEPYRSMPACASLALPVTEKLSAQVMCLPTGTSISNADIDAICSVVRLALSCPKECRAALASPPGDTGRVMP
jgi:dTDP-4-amino-4,6-dideoxygalactose transaminase